MATVEIKIFKHHKKADGTYNIKVRVTHKREKKYLDTPHFVSDRQLTAKLAIKDMFLKKILNDLLDDYRTTISELGEKLDLFTAESLRDYLKVKNEPIDFIKFSEAQIKELKEADRMGSAKTLQTVVLSLIDFFQRRVISPNEIDEQFLARWEKYLRTPRKIVRTDQFGRSLKRNVKALGDSGVHNRMRDLRILFKAAMKHYNKPKIDFMPIPHDPFENFKIVSPPETKKRNLPAEQLRLLFNYKAEPGSRIEMAREMFLLSLYLCGMNAVDFYHLDKDNIVNGRVEYNRTKTESRRKDEAFISIKLVRPAKKLLEKYLGIPALRYSTFENFDHALNEGLRIICKHLQIKRFTFYWARHTFGSIARNKAGMLLEDIAMALNHINDEHKVTDIYIEKDWSLIDKVQMGVLKYLEKNVFKYKEVDEMPQTANVTVRNIFEFVKLEMLAG